MLISFFSLLSFFFFHHIVRMLFLKTKKRQKKCMMSKSTSFHVGKSLFCVWGLGAFNSRECIVQAEVCPSNTVPRNSMMLLFADIQVRVFWPQACEGRIQQT